MTEETVPWRYQASARGPRAILVLAAWWLALAIGLFVIELNPWIAGVLFLFSLPAAYEMLRGRMAWLEIHETGISWGSGRRSGSLSREEFDKVRLDTRLDFSLRMSLILHSGRKIRLPYECIPRAARLKEALEDAQIPYDHHHFALMS